MELYIKGNNASSDAGIKKTISLRPKAGQRDIVLSPQKAFAFAIELLRFAKENGVDIRDRLELNHSCVAEGINNPEYFDRSRNEYLPVTRNGINYQGKYYNSPEIQLYQGAVVEVQNNVVLKDGKEIYRLI